MNHADVQSRMADYLDGDLRLDERALFDAHLDSCGSCARDLSELQGTVSLLRSLPAPPTPPDLADNVIATLREGGANSAWQNLRDAAAAWLSPSRILVPATALAAASAVFLVSGGQLGTLTPTAPNAQIASSASSKAQTQPRALPSQRVERRVAATPVPAAPSDRVASRAPVQGAAGAVAAESAEPEALVSHAPAATTVPTSSGVFQPSRFGNAPTTLVSGAATGGAQRLPGAVSSQSTDSERVGRERLLDERLALLQQDPQQFAAWLGARSVAERELWLEQFARYASERGIGGAVLQAFRSSKDPRLESAAMQFAEDLSESLGVEPIR